MDRIIGVAVGLVTMYLMLSILASHIQELLATNSQTRSKLLSTAISTLLGNAALTQAFYSHPLVKALVPAPKKGTPASGKALAPAYIPADIFRKVLLTVLGQMHSPQATGLKDVLAQMPDSALRQSLSTMIMDATNDAGIAQAIENWYLNAMDRTIGLYKRQTQGRLLIVGFVLAAAFNANTFHTASVLWSSSSARDQAQLLAQQCLQGNNQTCGKDPTVDVSKLKDSIGKLPVGWSRDSSAAWTSAWDAWREAMKTPEASPGYPRLGQIGDDSRILLSVLVGWLFTAVAVSWGAPFWFDLLNQIVNLRIAGPKPESSAAGTAQAEAKPKPK